MDAKQLTVETADGTRIAVTRRPSSGGAAPGRTVVFLHAGVADRRAWDGVMEALGGTGSRDSELAPGRDLDGDRDSELAPGRDLDGDRDRDLAADRDLDGDRGGDPAPGRDLDSDRVPSGDSDRDSNLDRAPDLDLVSYDRRGFGETPAAVDPEAFTHVDDLIAVLDGLGLDRVALVGNSMGGALALDAALLHPERIESALVIGSAVSGMTDEDTPFDWEADADSGPLMERAEDAEAPIADRIAALAHLWLDGPAAPEGRVGGAARDLFVLMNRRIIEVAAPGSAGDAGVETWTRLGEITVPVLSCWGDLDIPADVPFYEEAVRRLGQGPARVLPDVAHLPALEQSEVVAPLVREWLATPA